MAVTKGGRSAVAATSGNPDCHIILRGGKAPNYDAGSVEAAGAIVARVGVNPAIMIDASHANSGKQPEKQPLVVEAVSAQIEAGEHRIIGMMVESNLLGGRQDLIAGTPLIYGRSITDACLDWEKTVGVLEALWRVRLKGDDGGSHWLQGMPRRPWVQARIGALAQLVKSPLQ